MLDAKWADYARTWSLQDVERDAALADLVVQDVVYSDPASQVTGRAAFSAHMAQFQKDMPGAYFEVFEVKAHHDKSLARCMLYGRDRVEIMQGTSYAVSGQGEKFASFTGFF